MGSNIFYYKICGSKEIGTTLVLWINRDRGQAERKSDEMEFPVK